MSEKRKGSRRDDDNQLRAGVDPDEEREIRQQSREEADDEAIGADVAYAASAPVPTSPDGEEPIVEILKELPDNGAVLHSATPGLATADQEYARLAATDHPTANTYSDEFVGQGGSYVIDGETGERKRVFTEIRNDKGKVTGYVPAP
jgi:hypothetical protein